MALGLVPWLSNEHDFPRLYWLGEGLGAFVFNVNRLETELGSHDVPDLSYIHHVVHPFCFAKDNEEEFVFGR